MKIRIANLKDFPEIQTLFQALFELFPNKQKEEWPHTQEGLHYLSNAIHSEYVFVAELNDQIVGYLMWAIRQGPSFQTFKHYAELQNMYVSEPHRKKGIGKKLCEMFFDACKEEHLDTIMVESAVLPETVRFYESRGFIEERKVMFLHHANSMTSTD